QSVTPAIAKSMNLPNDHGALVADVTKDSPAQKAGFKQGDVIESFNGHQIEKLRDLPIMVAETPIGSNAKVEIDRDGKQMTLDTTIAEQPANLGQLAEAGGGTHSDQAAGLALAPLTRAERERFHVPEHVKGVVVRSISDSSPFNDVDLRPGDVIVAVNQQPVTSPGEAAEKLDAAMKGPDKHVLLLLNRHGESEYVALSEAPNQG
ncbi:MAG TPA: PDZ domain-containing protein, partial [Stellaceae bacterium]|nr:PDZ domain-containing protein [Stellaceae bacterium]